MHTYQKIGSTPAGVIQMLIVGKTRITELFYQTKPFDKKYTVKN